MVPECLRHCSHRILVGTVRWDAWRPEAGSHVTLVTLYIYPRHSRCRRTGWTRDIFSIHDSLIHSSIESAPAETFTVMSPDTTHLELLDPAMESTSLPPS